LKAQGFPSGFLPSFLTYSVSEKNELKGKRYEELQYSYLLSIREE